MSAVRHVHWLQAYNPCIPFENDSEAAAGLACRGSAGGQSHMAQAASVLQAAFIADEDIRGDGGREFIVRSISLPFDVFMIK